MENASFKIYTDGTINLIIDAKKNPVFHICQDLVLECFY